MSARNTPTETLAPEPDAPAPVAEEPSPPESDPVADTAPDNAAASGDIATRIRAEAADITEIAAQAARLGVAVDAAKALREGTSPDALRAEVLSRAAAASESRDVIATAPSPTSDPKPKESPLVAAAKRTASGAPV